MSIKEAVDRFASGSNVLNEAIKGLAPADFDAFPVPGTWSIRQLIHHVLDSDLIAAHRMKRIIAEKNPLLIGYDETAFAKNLGYERMDVALAAECFRLNRELLVQALRGLPADAFSKSGVHNERGRVTLLELVEDYAEHLDHHMRFLREKRQRLGKPLAI